RPAVHQRAGEGGWLVAFQPNAGVAEQRNAGRVGYGKTVAAKALDLREEAREEFGWVLYGEPALGQPLTVFFQAAMAFPGGHAAAQLVGFARGVTGGNHGQFHDLFLEQRYAQGALEYRDQFLRGVEHRLLAVAPAQVGMDHVALDRP